MVFITYLVREAAYGACRDRSGVDCISLRRSPCQELEGAHSSTRRSACDLQHLQTVMKALNSGLNQLLDKNDLIQHSGK